MPIYFYPTSSFYEYCFFSICPVLSSSNPKHVLAEGYYSQIAWDTQRLAFNSQHKRSLNTKLSLKISFVYSYLQLSEYSYLCQHTYLFISSKQILQSLSSQFKISFIFDLVFFIWAVLIKLSIIGNKWKGMDKRKIKLP